MATLFLQDVECADAQDSQKTYLRSLHVRQLKKDDLLLHFETFVYVMSDI
jgi:hypothetical protein